MGTASHARIASLLLVGLSFVGCKGASGDFELPAQAVQLGANTRAPKLTNCELPTGSSTTQAKSPEPSQPLPGKDTTGDQGTQDATPKSDIPISPLCAGLENGALCGDYAVCIDQRCMPSICGDGIVHKGLEECEDGNRERNDGCYACILERCGDGRIHPGEACDDGNNIRTDGCDHQCQRTAQNLCGNGTVEGKEECDDGNLVHDDGCRNDCRRHALEKCGNGTIDPGESCDDGNLRENDGCGPSCQTETCGDGFIFAKKEQCDDGNLVDGDGCSAKCRVEIPVCGNGVVDLGEECDDGNNRNGDDCPNDCKKAVCADGVIDGHESCDDGNLVDGDGCSAECVKETRCGNGIVEFQVGGEQCDDANDNNFDRCTNDCKVPYCGDGQRNGAFEECDGEDAPEGKNCDDSCFVKPLCGNGVVERSVRYLDTSELCDDGNTQDGDSCAADCRGIGLSKCGDGTVQPELGEECDLGPVPDGMDETDAHQRSLLCNNCKWAFFSQACSECVAPNMLLSDLPSQYCLASDPGPCREVTECFLKERCTQVSKMGPLACSCGELSLAECKEIERFPGPCHEIAVSRSFDPEDENRALKTDRGSFFNGLRNPAFPYGQAALTMQQMIVFCPDACAEYLAPRE